LSKSSRRLQPKNAVVNDHLVRATIVTSSEWQHN